MPYGSLCAYTDLVYIDVHICVLYTLLYITEPLATFPVLFDLYRWDLDKRPRAL